MCSLIFIAIISIVLTSILTVNARVVKVYHDVRCTLSLRFS